MSFMVKEILGLVIDKTAIWQQVEVGVPLDLTKSKRPKVKERKPRYDRDIFDLARSISNRAYARRRNSMSSSII
jgi:hypothetical protein